MLQFFRDVLKWKMPHPTYGKCGGSDLICSDDDEPIDAMDRLFQEHDMNFALIDEYIRADNYWIPLHHLFDEEDWEKEFEKCETLYEIVTGKQST